MGYEQGELNARLILANELTRLREGKQGAGDYLRALDDIAGAMGLKSKTETVVRYTA